MSLVNDWHWRLPQPRRRYSSGVELVAAATGRLFRYTRRARGRFAGCWPLSRARAPNGASPCAPDAGTTPRGLLSGRCPLTVTSAATGHLLIAPPRTNVSGRLPSSCRLRFRVERRHATNEHSSLRAVLRLHAHGATYRSSAQSFHLCDCRSAASTRPLPIIRALSTASVVRARELAGAHTLLVGARASKANVRVDDVRPRRRRRPGRRHVEAKESGRRRRRGRRWRARRRWVHRLRHNY